MQHDLRFNYTDFGIVCSPGTVHGMLWLQTHFADEDWEALAAGEGFLDEQSAALVANDADLSGLRIFFP